MPADRKANRDAPDPRKPEGQVLLFRPRPSVGGRAARPTAPAGNPESVRKRWPEPWEDYYGDESEEHPRRSLINVVGVVCTLLLIGTGLWLAHTLVEMRKIQDCVLAGRTNCAPIDRPVDRPVKP